MAQAEARPFTCRVIRADYDVKNTAGDGKRAADDGGRQRPRLEKASDGDRTGGHCWKAYGSRLGVDEGESQRDTPSNTLMARSPACMVHPAYHVYHDWANASLHR